MSTETPQKIDILGGTVKKRLEWMIGKLSSEDLVYEEPTIPELTDEEIIQRGRERRCSSILSDQQWIKDAERNIPLYEEQLKIITRLMEKTSNPEVRGS